MEEVFLKRVSLIKDQHTSSHQTPYSYTHCFLSTTIQLGKIRRLGYKQFLYFWLYVNSLKKFFVTNAKFNCLKNMSIFSYSLLPKVLKLRRSSLRLFFLIKIVSRVFEIALEGWREWKGGRNGNFTLESFNHSMLLSC